MSTTCTTFASMRPKTVASRNLDATLCNFVLDAFQMSHPGDPGAPTTHIPSLSMSRRLVTIHDHEYAVIERDGILLIVFDLSTDPFELNDITGSIAHLRPTLKRTVCTDSSVDAVDEFTAPTPRAPRTPPLHVSIPSPSSSEVSSTMTSTVRTVARQDSFTRRNPRAPLPPPSSVSQNVRRTEQRLHKLHR